MSVRVRISREIYLRAKEFSAQHDRTLTDVLDEAIDFWLRTVGEVSTEELLDAAPKDIN
jgi:hypothetical protein